MHKFIRSNHRLKSPKDHGTSFSIAMIMRSSWMLVFALLVIISCTPFPRDPQGTTSEVRSGGLRVGISTNPPFVTSEEVPSGTEVDLITEFARSLNSEIYWHPGNLEVLLKDLEEGDLDLVIGGINSETPWISRKIGITNPYMTYQDNEYVMAVRQGENEFLINLEDFLYSHRQSAKK